jgi:hypothetical protein
MFFIESKHNLWLCIVHLFYLGHQYQVLPLSTPRFHLILFLLSLSLIFMIEFLRNFRLPLLSILSFLLVYFTNNLISHHFLLVFNFLMHYHFILQELFCHVQSIFLRKVLHFIMLRNFDHLDFISLHCHQLLYYCKFTHPKCFGLYRNYFVTFNFWF